MRPEPTDPVRPSGFASGRAHERSWTAAASPQDRERLVEANGLTLATWVRGDGAPVLLIHGLGQTVPDWPDAFVGALADDGHAVLRFDNRDVGRSTRFAKAGDPPLVRIWTSAKLGIRPLADPPYTLGDMAADCAGLLDAFGWSSAHVVGVSMGGMIAQHLAARHPTRVRSLTSIMSSSGAHGLPSMRRDVAWHLMEHAPRSVDTAIRQAIAFRDLVAGPMSEEDRRELHGRIERSMRYGWPQDAGGARQFAAIMADRERPDLLADIRCPTLVLHGANDPFVPHEHGQDTARRIANARLFVLPDMGHEITASVAPRLAGLIAEHVAAVDHLPQNRKSHP